MESKLQRLLKEINLEEEYYEEFQNGTLDKVSVYENNKLWVFKIILDNILNIKTYISFLTKLKDKFNLKILKVKSHAHNKWNDYTDLLAVRERSKLEK